MKYPIHLFFLLVCCCGMSLKCNTNEDPLPQLPPETQYGANTIGCLVNGEVFVPKQHNLNGFSFGYANNHMSFTINNDIGKISVSFQDNSIVDTGKYDMTTVHGILHRNVNYFHNITDLVTKGYETNSAHTGTLYIKKWDKQKHIMTGTFHFDAISADSNIVQIRQGRFDMIYN